MSQRLGTRKYLAAKMAIGQGTRVQAQNDSKTCAWCKSQNGKFAPANKPPYHPNCRCTE